MKEHGLKLAQEKSEAVLVTKRGKFEYTKLVLGGHTIQFQDSIRYLGLWIDKHWNFKDHIRRTPTKAGHHITGRNLASCRNGSDTTTR